MIVRIIEKYLYFYRRVLMRFGRLFENMENNLVPRTIEDDDEE